VRDTADQPVVSGEIVFYVEIAGVILVLILFVSLVCCCCCCCRKKKRQTGYAQLETSPSVQASQSATPITGACVSRVLFTDFLQILIVLAPPSGSCKTTRENSKCGSKVVWNKATAMVYSSENQFVDRFKFPSVSVLLSDAAAP
jgi:hypothetical protein